MDAFIEALLSDGKSPLIPERDDLYGRFVGEWDFEWFDHLDEPEPRHVRGEWIFRRILEGLAVQDLFICPSRATRAAAPQPDPAYGTTVRMYNPRTGAWDILYTEWGCATRLEARMEEGRIVQRAADNDCLRWVFSDIAPDSFRWERMTSGDGVHWKTEACALATRKKPAGMPAAEHETTI